MQTVRDAHPALIHPEGLHKVRVAVVDLMSELRVLDVFVILGRYGDEITADLPGLPQRHPGLYASALGKLGFGEDDPVPVLYRSAHGHRLAAKTMIQHGFHGVIERVQIGVQDGLPHVLHHLHHRVISCYPG